VTGETLTVSATVFREGHDAVAADVVVARPDGTSLPFLPMVKGEPGTDRWSTSFEVDAEGMWTWHVEAWDDPLGTWWHDSPLKVDAGVDVDVMLEEGARLYAEAAKGLPKQLTKADRTRVTGVVDVLRDGSRSAAERMAAGLDPSLVALRAPADLGRPAEGPLRRLVRVLPAQRGRRPRRRRRAALWHLPHRDGAPAGCC
jgi:starch synthase (maltosyl-transferring)